MEAKTERETVLLEWLNELRSLNKEHKQPEKVLHNRTTEIRLKEKIIEEIKIMVENERIHIIQTSPFF